jgi:hypothetical protein
MRMSIVAAALFVLVLSSCFTNTVYVPMRMPELQMPPAPPGRKSLTAAEITPYLSLAGPTITAANDAISLYFNLMQQEAKNKADASTAALKTVWAYVAVEQQAHAVRAGLLSSSGDATGNYIRALEYELQLYIRFARQSNRGCGLYEPWSADTDTMMIVGTSGR